MVKPQWAIYSHDGLVLDTFETEKSARLELPEYARDAYVALLLEVPVPNFLADELDWLARVG